MPRRPRVEHHTTASGVRHRRLLATVAGVALAAVLAMLSGAQLRSTSPQGQGAPRRTVPPPPDVQDPWKVAPAQLPAPPRTSQTVSVPAAWQHLDDIGAVWADWLEDVPDGTLIMFPPGTYRTSDRLLVRGRHDLILRGPPSGPPARLVQSGDGRSFDYAPQRVVLMIYSSQRVVVEHLTIVGANPRASETDPMQNPLEGQHGISVTMESRDVRVAGNDISAVYGDGISAQGASERTLIEHNSIRNVARQGISSLDAYDTTVRENDIADVALDGIDVEPNRSGGRVHVVRNRLGGKHPRLNASGPVLSDVTFADNVADGPLSVRIRAWPRPDGTWQRLERIAVIGNRGSIPPADGRPEIEALNVDFLTVAANRVDSGAGTIWLIGSCPVRLEALHRDPTMQWTVRFQASPTSGSAPEAAPTAVLTTPSDRLDPVPTLQHLTRQVTGQEASAEVLRRDAAEVCTGRRDRAQVAASLLERSPDGPLAQQARLATVGVVTRGELVASPASEADSTLVALLDPSLRAVPGTFADGDPLERLARAADEPRPALPADAPGRRAAAAADLVRDAPAGSSLATIHQVVTAHLLAKGRLPSPDELIDWVHVTRMTRPDLIELVRRISRAPVAPLRADPAAPGCDERPVEQRLLELARSSQPFFTPRPVC